MSKALGIIIQYYLTVIGEHSIEYGCVEYSCIVRLRKQQETGWHSLLLVDFRQCIIHSLAQLQCLPNAVQVKNGYLRANSLLARKRSTNLTYVWLLPTYTASSFRTCSRLQRSRYWNPGTNVHVAFVNSIILKRFIDWC